MKDKIKKGLNDAGKAIVDNPVKTGLGVAAALFAGKKIYDKVTKKKNNND